MYKTQKLSEVFLKRAYKIRQSFFGKIKLFISISSGQTDGHNSGILKLFYKLHQKFPRQQLSNVL